ncbi:hypothetical protein LTR17_010862 [Elasticomyces elasticus]|nr:hypothetical protein LTR17_010862 [Elasticomyces elasticus]
MAEIAGSAVGVVSLGIQVCQGLLQYYGDWKGFDKDIEASHKAVEGLTETFVLLAQVLKGNVAVKDDQRRHVESCVAGCKDSVGHLRDRLAELRKYKHPTAFREKVKASGSRLLYPFKKESLDVLRNLVQEILQRLMLAISVLNADAGLEMRTAIASMQTDLSSLGQSSADVLKAVRDLADKLNGVAGYMIGFQQSFDLLTVRTGQTAFDIKQLLTFEEAKQRQKVLNWLPAPDPTIDQMAARKQHQPGTCEWFLTSQQYTMWTQGQSPHVWLHGKAGCCKTVLTSSIIEDLSLQLLQQPGCALAYFYFSFAEPQKQSYHNMLLSFVWQLSRDGKLLPELAAAYASGRTLNSKDLENMVDALAERCGRLFFVIDALDEVPEGNSARQDVLDGIQTLSNRNSNVRFLMTSRPDADINEFMSEWQIAAFPLDEVAVNADINVYVATRLSEDRRFRGKEWSNMRQEILGTFQQKAQGMFRWATCQLEDLAAIKICTPRYIRARLTALPKTLPATYERMLNAIEEEYIEAARHALTWLAFAERELTLQELEETYIIQPGKQPAVDEENRAPPGSIIRVLKSLVVVAAQVEDPDGFETFTDDSESEMFSLWGNVSPVIGGSLHSDEDLDAQRGNNAKVRLAHYSVKEYLTSNLNRSSPVSHFALLAHEGHKYIVRCCLAYLVYHEGPVWDACAESDGLRHSRYGLLRTIDRSRTALLQYVAVFWHHHQHTVEQTDGSNANEVADFLRTHRELLRVLRAISQSWWEYQYLESEAHLYGLPVVAPLELAISESLGPLPHTLRALCAAGEDVNANRHLCGESALRNAVRQRNETMVSTLVEFGADVNCFGEDDSTGYPTSPLLLACGDDSYSRDVVKLLVESGADVNACGGHPGEPWTYASQTATPLFAALYMGCFNPHAYDAKWNTLLRREKDTRGLTDRTIDNRLDVVDILLRHGADVCEQAGEDGSLLVTVARYDDGRLTSRLLDAGASVNSKGYYSYPLESAVQYGNHVAAKLLLEAGADPGHGWKALIALFPCYHERPEMCKKVEQVRVVRILEWASILLAAGSEPHPIYAIWALASYARTGYSEVVSLVLPFSTDVNYRDACAGTALYEAKRELKWRCDISTPHYEPIEENQRFCAVIDLLQAKGADCLPPIGPSPLEDHTHDGHQVRAVSKDYALSYAAALKRRTLEHLDCSGCPYAMDGMRYKCLNCTSVDYCDYCFSRIRFEHEDSHDFVAVMNPHQLRHTLVMAKRMLQDPGIREPPLNGARKGLVIMELPPHPDYTESDSRVSDSNAENGTIDSDAQISESDAQVLDSSDQGPDATAGPLPPQRPSWMLPQPSRPPCKCNRRFGCPKR